MARRMERHRGGFAFVESNLGTRMLVDLHSCASTHEMQEAIEKAHLKAFPNYGSIRVTNTMVYYDGYWWQLLCDTWFIVEDDKPTKLKIEVQSRRDAQRPTAPRLIPETATMGQDYETLNASNVYVDNTQQVHAQAYAQAPRVALARTETLGGTPASNGGTLASTVTLGRCSAHVDIEEPSQPATLEYASTKTLLGHAEKGKTNLGNAENGNTNMGHLDKAPDDEPTPEQAPTTENEPMEVDVGETSREDQTLEHAKETQEQDEHASMDPEEHHGKHSEQEEHASTEEEQQPKTLELVGRETETPEQQKEAAAAMEAEMQAAAAEPTAAVQDASARDDEMMEDEDEDVVEDGSGSRKRSAAEADLLDHGDGKRLKQSQAEDVLVKETQPEVEAVVEGTQETRMEDTPTEEPRTDEMEAPVTEMEVPVGTSAVKTRPEVPDAVAKLGSGPKQAESLSSFTVSAVDKMVGKLVTQHFTSEATTEESSELSGKEQSQAGEECDSEEARGKEDAEKTTERDRLESEKTQAQDDSESENMEDSEQDLEPEETPAQEKPIENHTEANADESESSSDESEQDDGMEKEPVSTVISKPDPKKAELEEEDEDEESEESEESEEEDESDSGSDESTVSEKWKPSVTEPRTTRSRVDPRLERFVESRNGMNEFLSVALKGRKPKGKVPKPAPGISGNSSPSLEGIIDTQPISASQEEAEKTEKAAEKEIAWKDGQDGHSKKKPSENGVKETRSKSKGSKGSKDKSTTTETMRTKSHEVTVSDSQAESGNSEASERKKVVEEESPKPKQKAKRKSDQVEESEFQTPQPPARPFRKAVAETAAKQAAKRPVRKSTPSSDEAVYCGCGKYYSKKTSSYYAHRKVCPMGNKDSVQEAIVVHI